MRNTRTRTARTYDRIARVYDWYEAPMDRMGGRERRERVMGGAHGRVLEIGTGTGRNFEFYPKDVELTGVDISSPMLGRTRRRGDAMGRDATLSRADAQALPFRDASFDTVTASCVFCSVDDPVRGLAEAKRVVRPGGQVRLLEHVRPRNPILGKLFDLLSPITRRLLGPEINRRTEDNVRASGLEILTVRVTGVWREIVARPALPDASTLSTHVSATRTGFGIGTGSAFLLGLVLLAAACDTTVADRPGADSSTSPDTTVVIHSRAPAADAFRGAVRSALPWLVFVQVEGIPPEYRGWPGSRSGAAPFGRDESEIIPLGSGSGFIVDTAGLVLTNNHVVQEASVVSVILGDNRRLEAAVVGRDPDTDLALLRIEAAGLAAARLGNSDSLQVGDWVLALGYPLGLSATVTAGIVSGTGRRLGILAGSGEAVAPLEYFIQTDAAINPGNSGGPMVDLAGSVVGVNSAIASPTGYYTGYGFAVPINLARRVVDDLIRYGEVRRPAIGVRIRDVTPADAQVFGLPAISGAAVAAVVDGGPAASAGIEPGDVIVNVDSTAITNSGDLQALLLQRRPGQRISLRAIRYGTPLEFTVELSRLPGAVSNTTAPAEHTGPARLGFNVVQNRGVLVIAQVDRFSPAARAGIRPGQRLMALNRQAVNSLAELRSLLDEVRLPAVLSLRVVDPALGETIVNFEPEPLHGIR